MYGCVLAAALAALPSQRAADAALADYMTALAATQARWARMAQLVVDGKRDEAKALTRPLPAVLAKDFGAVESGLLTHAGLPDADTVWWGGWALARQQPALAAALFWKAEQSGAFIDTGERHNRFQACIQAGDLACVARLNPEMARNYPSSRARLEALAGGALGPADSLRVRADHHTGDSATLALERWALQPLTAGDRAERLKLLPDVLPAEGARLARLALVVDAEAPADHFVAAIKALAASPTGADDAQVYWLALAVDARVPEGERAAALLQLGLIRKRQGRSGEALALFRQALPLGGESAATVALQVAHTLLERGEYEAALVAYREAESRDAWDPKARTRGDHLVPYVLYQGICLERLGRVREAVAEYAFVLLRAPLWWRRPLALHLIELYEAGGGLDVLTRFLEGAGEGRYAETIPVRTLMIVRRLEKDGDWPSLVAHVQSAGRAIQTTSRADRGRAYGQTAAAHALARHCDDAVPLLSAVDDGERPFVAYARGLCVPGSDRFERHILADLESERVMPELDFPPVKPVDLPDPIVCAEHLPSNVQAGASKPPCP